MSQIALPLDWPAAETRASFIVGPSNEAAVRHLDAPARWPVAATILTGPRKSGRSLLGRIFVARTGGVMIDQADRHGERALFAAWNDAQDSRRPLLMITDEQIDTAWEPALPDLKSRLNATPRITLGQPDEDLLARLLVHLLARRGLAVVPGVGAYVAARIERSHVAMLRVIDALDENALAARRAITVPLARDVISALHGVDATRNAG